MRGEGLNQIYSRETSPLILMQLQITNIGSVRIGVFYLIFETSKWNTYNEPAHDKTYSKTCVASKDSDQTVHPPSMARFLIYLSLDSLAVVDDILLYPRPSIISRFLCQISEDSNQMQMHRMIWVFAGRRSLIVGLVIRRLIHHCDETKQRAQ